jgi:hypothetical protein
LQYVVVCCLDEFHEGAIDRTSGSKLSWKCVLANPRLRFHVCDANRTGTTSIRGHDALPYGANGISHVSLHHLHTSAVHSPRS